MELDFLPSLTRSPITTNSTYMQEITSYNSFNSELFLNNNNNNNNDNNNNNNNDGDELSMD